MGGVEKLVKVGRVVKPHGIRGDVKVVPFIERTDQIVKASKVFVRTGEGEGKWMDVERGRIQGENIILKLDGIDDRNAAEQYRKAEIELQGIGERSLPEDTYIVENLLGFSVILRNRKTIGRVVDILNMPAQDVFVIESEKGEILIPAVKEWIVDVDVAQRMIVIEWMEGL